MINWEKEIIAAFENHYFASAPETGEDRRILRIRSSILFPDFDTAPPDEKESYLDAAVSLERKGLVKLRWEKWSEGERLKTFSCNDFEKLFAEAGRPYPQTEAENTRTMLREKADALKKNLQSAQPTEKILSLLEYLSDNFGSREIGQGLNQHTMEEFVRFLEFTLEPSGMEKITIRALSILLYRDSKRLENLLDLCKPFYTRSQKIIPSLDIIFPERSYPETTISGKIILEDKNSNPLIINAGGLMLVLPLESAKEIAFVKPIEAKTEAKNEKTVLTIENKETFYALGTPQKDSVSKNLSCYDCFVYTGGYPNRATAALIKALANTGFSFFHAGDLDPDGVLILQNIQDIAERPVTPVRMDAVTFDQYLTWARPLAKSMLRQTEKIREETRAISGLADLLQRIQETGLGVEQEIIDYR